MTRRPTTRRFWQPKPRTSSLARLSSQADPLQVCLPSIAASFLTREKELLADHQKSLKYNQSLKSSCYDTVEEISTTQAGAPAFAPAPVQPLNTDVIRLPATDPALSNDGGSRRLLQEPWIVGALYHFSSLGRICCLIGFFCP